MSCRSSIADSAVVGSVFGKWTVIGERTGNKVPVRCFCNTETHINVYSLVSGRSKSCRYCSDAQRRIPDEAKNTSNSNYIAWRNMRMRCRPGRAESKYYADRGITVYHEWDDPKTGYEKFIACVGPKPTPHHSLDRIDTNRGYEPGNVRWAVAYEQSSNRRCVRMHAAFGRTMTLSAWCREFHTSATLVDGRLRRGWTLEDALLVNEDTLKSTVLASSRSARLHYLTNKIEELECALQQTRHALQQLHDTTEDHDLPLDLPYHSAVRPITAFGITRTISEWSRVTGIHRQTIRARLRRGIDPERALRADRIRAADHVPVVSISK